MQRCKGMTVMIELQLHLCSYNDVRYNNVSEPLGYEVTRLQGYEVTRLRGYEVTRLRGCEVTPSHTNRPPSLRPLRMTSVCQRFRSCQHYRPTYKYNDQHRGYRTKGCRGAGVLTQEVGARKRREK